MQYRTMREPTRSEVAMLLDMLADGGPGNPPLLIDVPDGSSEPCGHEHLVETIRTWSKAYPLDVFPEPDWPSIDPHLRTVVSAGMGRHVIGRLVEVLEANAPRVIFIDDTPARDDGPNHDYRGRHDA